MQDKLDEYASDMADFKEVNWTNVIKDITACRIEPGKKPRWRYEDVGFVIGISRSAIGRMVKEPVRFEPSYSTGIKLLQLRKNIMETANNA